MNFVSSLTIFASIMLVSDYSDCETNQSERFTVLFNRLSTSFNQTEDIYRLFDCM